MSYERVLVNRWAREMSIAAKHMAHAVGAGNRAVETAAQLCPEFGAQNETFFGQLGLRPGIRAIGNYIGDFMWDVYDDEMAAAVDYGYQDAAGTLRR
jgi:hypothetical protein